MKRLLLLPLALPLVAAGDMTMMPGKWTTTVEIIDVKMANAPPAVAAAMKGRPMTMSTCLTPEKARQGVRGAIPADTGCKFTAFNAAAGRVSSRMTCTRPTGTMNVMSSGTYTATGYAMTAHMVGTGQSAMTMTTRTTGRRIGPC